VASFAGNLKEIGAAEIVRFLHACECTGTLLLYEGPHTAELGFELGRLVSAVGSFGDRLGTILLRHGAVRVADIDQAVEEQQQRVLRSYLGHLLLGRGAVNREALQRALAERIRDVLSTAVSWRQGAFEFREEQVLAPAVELDGAVPAGPGFSTAAILAEAERIFEARSMRAKESAAGGGFGPELWIELEPSREPLQAWLVSRDGGWLESSETLMRGAGLAPRSGGSLAAFEACPQAPGVVVFDLRRAGAALDAVSLFRRVAPKALLLGVAGSGAAYESIFGSGIDTILPESPAALVNFLSALGRHEAALPLSTAPPLAPLARAERFLDQVRSGLSPDTRALVLLRIAAELFERGLLMRPVQGGLVVLGAFGTGRAGIALTASTSQLRIPPGPHVLWRCAEQGVARHGPPRPGELPPELVQLLPEGTAIDALVMPILCQRRVVAVVYAESSEPLSSEGVHLLQAFSDEVGGALEAELSGKHPTIGTRRDG
jgi:hypothetical protein